MTKKELLTELNTLGINPRFYSIEGELKGNTYKEGELKEDAYNLRRKPEGLFIVFYLERGKAIDPKVLSNEDEAYDELLRRIKKELNYGINLS